MNNLSFAISTVKVGKKKREILIMILSINFYFTILYRYYLLIKI